MYELNETNRINNQLSFAWEEDNQPLEQIAKNVSLEKDQLQTQLKLMQGIGVLTMVHDESNSACTVELTEVGKNIHNKVNEAKAAENKQPTLSMDEFVNLRRSLHGLAKTMREDLYKEAVLMRK